MRARSTSGRTDGETDVEMAGHHRGRHMSGGVPRGPVEHLDLASPAIKSFKAGIVCYVVKPAVVGGVHHTVRFLQLTATRLIPLMGVRYFTRVRLVKNGEGGSDSVWSMIVSDAILVLLTIVTTNLPVVTNMRRKPGVGRTLGTERGQNETSTIAERPLPKAGEEVSSRHEVLGEQTCPDLPSLSSPDDSGASTMPSQTMSLSQLPQKPVLPTQSARAPQPARPSQPAQPTSPPPRSRQHSLKSSSSRSTVMGTWDGHSAHSVYLPEVPPKTWSTFDRER